MLRLCFVSSAAAKKAASSHPESSGEKVLKEGVNGEVEEGANGKAKGGQEVASGSKPRVYRRAEASEASGPGERKALDRDRQRCYCGTGTSAEPLRAHDENADLCSLLGNAFIAL